MIEREALLAEFQRLANGDDPPTTTEMSEQGAYDPSTYYDRFGSWPEACRAAGFPPRAPATPVTEEDLLTELRRLADGETPPSATEMKEEGAYSVPTYLDRFGSWNEACRVAGLTPRPQGRPKAISEEALLAELQRLSDGDTPPTYTEMNEEGAYAASTYKRRFGSWSEACREARLIPRSQGGSKAISEEALLAELQRLSDGQEPPTKAEMDEEGAYAVSTHPLSL